MVINRVFLIKCVSHLFILGWLLFTYYLAIIGDLGADPVDAVIHFTGIGALNLLLVTLTLSSIAKRFKLPILFRFRRLLGVYSFLYAFCHVLSFWAFEVQFDFQFFIQEISQRNYIIVGLSAFILLFALAITSFKFVQKKMKSRWQKLHNWVYLAAIFAVIHFYWSVKSELIEPLSYVLALVVLLYLRKKKLTKWFN